MTDFVLRDDRLAVSGDRARIEPVKDGLSPAFNSFP
jgi:hypothetical protein